MFERVVLRRSHDGPALTAGEIAEALLFYQNVHLFLDYGSIGGLIQQLGAEGLLAVLHRPGVTAVYTEQMLSTKTDTVGSYGTHSFQTMIFSGSKETGPLKRPEERMELVVRRHGLSNKDARAFVRRFTERVPFRQLSRDHFIRGGIPKAAMDDLEDSRYVLEAVRHVVRKISDAPQFDKFDFEVFTDGTNIRIYTDLDFKSLSAAQLARDKAAGQVTEANLLTAFLEATGDIVLAAHYGSDFHTSMRNSQIVRVRHGELLRRSGIHHAEREQFQEIVLPDFPSLREVINAKEKTWDDLLSLLDGAEKFKDWIRNVNPDQKLVENYLRDITATPAISKMPAKSLRYVLGAAVGAVEPATGFVASAIDSILLERWLGGWRPSHFVEQRLKPFLKSE